MPEGTHAGGFTFEKFYYLSFLLCHWSLSIWTSSLFSLQPSASPSLTSYVIPQCTLCMFACGMLFIFWVPICAFQGDKYLQRLNQQDDSELICRMAPWLIENRIENHLTIASNTNRLPSMRYSHDVHTRFNYSQLPTHCYCRYWTWFKTFIPSYIAPICLGKKTLEVVITLLSVKV